MLGEVRHVNICLENEIRKDLRSCTSARSKEISLHHIIVYAMILVIITLSMLYLDQSYPKAPP